MVSKPCTDDADDEERMKEVVVMETDSSLAIKS